MQNETIHKNRKGGRAIGEENRQGRKEQYKEMINERKEERKEGGQKGRREEVS